jgi:hypothetical protein
MQALAAGIEPEDVEVGLALRETLDALPAATRVAVIATGNLSLDVGGQRQFGPVAADREFDERVEEMMARKDLVGLADFCTFDRMSQAGTVTHAVLNLLTGAAMTEGLVTTHAEAMRRDGSSQPWFAWELPDLAKLAQADPGGTDRG